LAVGIIRPHLPFGAPAEYMTHYADTKLPATPDPKKPMGKTTWHGSGEFMKYNRWGRNPNDDPEFAIAVRKHYAACVSYADAQVGKLTDRLRELKKLDNTIVVLWGDHGWHLGEHAVWGKHTLFEESLRSPLIVSAPGMKHAGTTTDAVVETIDLFPTLCELAGLPDPAFVDGRGLTPILQSPDREGHDAVSYAKAETIRTATHRLIVHPGGHLELYDHRTDDAETRNIASENPELTQSLRKRLQQRLTKRRR